MMHNQYARPPEKLHPWQSTSRVERASQREKKLVTPPRQPDSAPGRVMRKADQGNSGHAERTAFFAWPSTLKVLRLALGAACEELVMRSEDCICPSLHGNTDVEIRWNTTNSS
jgi:hypothetical protein